MLIALMLFMLASGGGSTALTSYLDQISKYAKKQIADPAEKKAVLAIVDEMKGTQKDFSKTLKQTGKSLSQLVNDHHPTADEIRPVLTSFIEKDAQLRDKLLEQRFRLKSQMTREQWAASHTIESKD